MKTEYKLKCLGTGTAIDDIDMELESGISDNPALLRAIYEEKQLDLDAKHDGLFRFASWLPIRTILNGSSSPHTYQSEKLASHLGLSNLFITFSGYWPERGVEMVTGTFKECEAYSVCARLPVDFSDTLVVASAGNTARAFINVCSRNAIPLVVVVPEAALENLWADHEINPCVKIVAVTGEADYFDAIAVSEKICSLDGYRAEGGAKNVARRDGMGSTVLSAVTAIGEIPSYYFQAVGSGTGAIAAWEANRRLIADGRFGDRKMKLIVSQNDPFLVIYDSWRAGSRALVELNPEQARAKVAKAYAKVLSNRKPPYGLIGGLYDALVDSDGDVLRANNEEAETAAALFEELEGIDLAPAAAVAVASLQQAVANDVVTKDEIIMLNVTGGGYKTARKLLDLRSVEPDLLIAPDRLDLDEIERSMATLHAGVR